MIQLYLRDRPVRILGLLLLAAYLPCIAGCGGPTVRCEGQVLLDGEPLPGATVMFIPEDGSRVATGRTDTEGYFRLTTFEPGDGALPGEHRVTVTAFVPWTPCGAGGSDDSGAEIDDGPAGSGDCNLDFAPSRWTAPEFYSKPESSGLAATVGSGRRYFTFDLKPGLSSSGRAP